VKSKNREKGVALIMVLGLLSLVSVWAITAGQEDWISLRQAENMAQSSRAWMAAESGLELAHSILLDDIKKSQTDNLTEDWAQAAPSFPVDEGEVTASIEDANRFINLNDLVNVQGIIQPKAVAIVQRLFLILDIPPSLVYALVDWMDAADKPSGPGGAESAAYFDKSYGPKNAPLDRIEEISLIIGFDAEMLEKLRDVAIVRVSKGVTPVNINTASREVLLALSGRMAASDANTIIQMREDQPFAAVSQVTSQPLFASFAADLTAAGIDIKSDAFIVLSRARFGRVRWGEEALLARDAKGVQTIYRQRLGWMQ